MEQVKSIVIDLSHISENLKLYIDADKLGDIEVKSKYDDNLEAQYQIKEGKNYDYELSEEDYQLICRDQFNIIQKRKRQSNCGRIVPNIFVGTLNLEIFDINNPEKTYNQNLEVQSVKTSYREDYQYMLESITEKCTDLLLQANSPVSHSFETDFNHSNETLYQRFVFIKAMIESDRFEAAIHRIISSPVTQWKEQEELIDVRKIRRFNSSNIRQLISAKNKVKLPQHHYLRAKGLKSIATKINSNTKTECVDTPENRFIKYAMGVFMRFCDDMQSHKNAGDRLKQEAGVLVDIINNYLQNNIFKEISRPHTLKLNSPILQRKEGYREVLSVWLKFDLAAKLIWSGGQDIYSGGKKDIATLYEYWLFFKLLDVLKSVFSIEPKELKNLIKPTNDGLSLQLKQGKFTALKGTCFKGNRKLNIRFNYNRSFSANKDITKTGSWTTTLRPDYTLSIWPEELSEKEAEEKEQIVHIHFDAKYKVANIYKILDGKEKDQEQLNTEKILNLRGIYKNADLLKMHAYKDAIRRTSGAYILYPGDEKQQLQRFHEILPGLGAFAIKPNKNSANSDKETSHLNKFIEDVLEHFLNRATQRENLSTKTYQITNQTPSDSVKEPMPEYLNDKKMIPYETYVLVGFHNGGDHYKWIVNKHMYNFRMGSGNGSLVLDNDTVNAKYLLLHTHKDKSSGNLWKIISKGPQVFNRNNLQKKDYPRTKNKKKLDSSYLVIKIEKVNMSEFGYSEWDISKLKNYKKGNASAKPFTTTIAELSKCIIKQSE